MIAHTIYINTPSGNSPSLIYKKYINRNKILGLFCINSDTPSNYAKILLSNGVRYEGEVNNNDIPEGYGKVLWPSGIEYTGSLLGGYLHGPGIIKSPSGVTYEGSFKFNYAHGFGTCTNIGGHKYIGTFHIGYLHGQGTYFYPNGDKYEGTFHLSLRHGKGILIPKKNFYQLKQNTGYEIEYNFETIISSVECPI